MRYFAVALAASLLCFGCAETNIQAIHRLRPAYEVYRNDLANAILGLPEPGTVKAWTMPAKLYPKPVFYEDRMNDPDATAEIIYYGEKNEAVHLSIRSPIHFCLGWTGPKNGLSPDVWDRRGGLGEECDAALTRPWVVVLRMVESRLPKILRMEAHLFYAPNWSVVGSFPLVVYGQDESVREKGEPESLSSAFHQALGCELMQNLKKIPGGTFEFDYRRCDGGFAHIAIAASVRGNPIFDPAPLSNRNDSQ